MTGHNKVWRMPVACLASVAMLATVGVSAMTANAADVTFTFDGNGLTFTTASYDGDAKESNTFTIKDGQNGQKNGKLDAGEIEAATDALKEKNVFTGWYTVAGYGKENTAVQPGVAENTTVYAHWSEDQYKVSFEADYTVDQKNPVTLASKDGVLDRVASWQVPTDNSKTDHHMLSGWASKRTGAAVNPTADLSQDISYGTGNNTIQLKATWVDSFAVTFSTTDLWHESERHVELNGKQENVVVETEKGKPFTATVPSAAFVYNDGKIVTASKFVTDTTKKTVFDASKNVTKDQEWFASTPTTESYNVTFTTGAEEDGYSKAPETQLVETGETASKPVDPTLKDTDAAKYEFAGWYTNDGKPYDFSDPVTGPVELTAYFVVTEMKVTFDPNYTTAKKIEQWYGDGDVFQAPKVTRDGYNFVGWSAPADGTKLTLTSKPANRPEGELTYLMSDGTEAGTYTMRVESKYTAEWFKPENGEEKLKDLEAKVDVPGDAEKYTEASFKQYQSDWQDYLAKKAELAKNGYTVAEHTELVQMLNGIQAKLVQVANVTLYRLYNPNDGDHYYTPRRAEAENLRNVGWIQEKAEYKVVAADAAFGADVYSVYNPNTGEHLLTDSEIEAAALERAGWNWDNNKEAVFKAPQGATKAVYRVYNPNTNGPAHHYAGLAETSILVGKGWQWDNNANAMFYFG